MRVYVDITELSTILNNVKLLIQFTWAESVAHGYFILNVILYVSVYDI